jgi:hypothetical protein
MFNQVTYNVLIERFKAFADGHYKIERFSHGQIDVTDIDKEQRFPWMHVVPVSIQPSNGSRSFALDVVFADMPRDIESKTEYQRESLSDCIQLAEDLLAEIKNGNVIFGEDVTLEEGSAVQPFMEEYTHVLTGVTLSLTMTFPWNWNACDIPADWSAGGGSGGGGGGGGALLVLQVNDVDNVLQNILNITEGTNMTITDLGDGRVRFDSTAVGSVVSTEYNINHTTATGNQYLVGDYVWYNGNVYRCIASNDALLPTNTTYWTLVGTGNRLRQSPVDWNASSGDYQILNKPTIPTVTSDLTNDSGFITIGDVPTQVNADWNAVSGLAEILNKPTIPAAQIQSDWTQTNNALLDFIKNKPTLPTTIGDMLKSVYDTDADGVVDSAERIEIVVRNSTGVTLTKGQVVYLSGATGNRPNAILADASTEATSSKTIGLVTANIANNADGFVAVNGTLHDLDTSAFTAGDTLWLSETAGAMQANTPPSEPAHAVFIGYVARAHPTLGRIVLAIQNGYELNELHGVLITSEANKDALMYESASGLWKNRQIVSTDVSNSTDVGNNLLTLINPSAISYLRVNADNSVTARTPSQVLTDLGVSATIVLGRDFVGTTVVNTTTNTIAFSALITPNTLQVNDFIEVISLFNTNVLNGQVVTYRLYWNTSNTLTGAVQLASLSNSVGTGNTAFLRNIYVTAIGASGNIRLNGANVTNPYSLSSANAQNITINTTANVYILIGIQMGNAVSTSSTQGTLLRLTR